MQYAMAQMQAEHTTAVKPNTCKASMQYLKYGKTQSASCAEAGQGVHHIKCKRLSVPDTLQDTVQQRVLRERKSWDHGSVCCVLHSWIADLILRLGTSFVLLNGIFVIGLLHFPKSNHCCM